MLESIEKLRDCTWIGSGKVNVYLDKIEQEISERYMLLPVDADGVPWHVGDVTENGNTVNGICFDRHGCHFSNTRNDIDPSIHRHAKPRTLEDVLHDFANEAEWEQSPDSYDEIESRLITLYAAEIRRMIGGEL